MTWRNWARRQWKSIQEDNYHHENRKSYIMVKGLFPKPDSASEPSYYVRVTTRFILLQYFSYVLDNWIMQFESFDWLSHPGI